MSLVSKVSNVFVLGIEIEVWIYQWWESNPYTQDRNLITEYQATENIAHSYTSKL